MLPDPGQPAAGPVRRIVVVGNCGSGKSTLSAAIADRLHLPLVHLDLYYWRPGWTKPPAAAQGTGHRLAGPASDRL